MRAGEFEFLTVRPGAAATTLCGRNTVQVRPVSTAAELDLDAMALRLKVAGAVEQTPFFARCVLRETGMTLTLFPDGRAMIHGTSDPALAHSLYARFVGI